jgi:hypothetical protein
VDETKVNAAINAALAWHQVKDAPLPEWFPLWAVFYGLYRALSVPQERDRFWHLLNDVPPRPP